MKPFNTYDFYFRLILSIFILLASIQFEVTGQITINTINIGNRSELVDFFIYNEIRSPLISGHRGGERVGFPENSIPLMENTLQYTPAMFEIDPRLTKDSVIVLMHDRTIDRTTTGEGRLADYTWDELQQYRLIDNRGNETPYKIPLLEEVIEWSKGKTIINLDDKDVPYHMIADLVKKHNAFSYVLMTVHSAEIARQFYDSDQRFMFSAHIFDLKEIDEFEAAGIPWSSVIAYVGPRYLPERIDLYNALNRRGVKWFISGVRYLDQEFLDGDSEIYDFLFNNGSCIIETDLPVQAAQQLENLRNRSSNIHNYFGKKEIPLGEMHFKLPHSFLK